MRILYSHRIASRDGQGVHLDELVRAFREAGHEVRVVGPRSFERAELGEGGSASDRLRAVLPGWAGELAELLYAAPAWWRLRTAARQFKPDLVYERYNLFHLAGALLRGPAPFYLEVNAPIAAERTEHAKLRLRRLAHRLERWTWRRATRVLPVTSVLAADIAAAGIPRARIKIVPNGVVLAPFEEPTPTPSLPVTLGFVGFVRTWHGMDAILRAIAADKTGPACQLVLVGDGPARPELEALAATLGIAGQVRFTGVVEHARIPAAVAQFDIALQPRVVAYASPLKIFDYMAAARAIVAPDQPNIREILEHGRTALLFDPARPGAMWAAIRQLAADPALRERLGAAARAELVARDYTWAGNARRIAKWAAADRALNTAPGAGVPAAARLSPLARR